MKKFQLLTAAFLFICMAAFTGKTNAQSVGFTFPYVYQGNSVNYQITNITTPQVVVNSGTNVTGDLIIPDSVEYSSVWYKVKQIAASAFLSNTNITSLTVGNSMTTINSNAFRYCSGLNKIDIGTGMTYLYSYAFGGTGLDTIICRAVNPPNLSTTVFFGGVFDTWFSTCQLFVPTPTGYNNVTTQWTNFTHIRPIIGTEFGTASANRFKYRVTSDSTVHIIGPSTTWTNTSMTISSLCNINSAPSAYLPVNTNGSTTIYRVKAIAASAFSTNTAITVLTIGDGIDSIYYGGFSNCSNLHKITLPASMQYLGSYAFRYCAIDSLYCNAVTPPYRVVPTGMQIPMVNTFYSSLTATSKLFVPCQSIAAYQASNWVSGATNTTAWFQSANVLHNLANFTITHSTEGVNSPDVDLTFEPLSTNTCRLYSMDAPAAISTIIVPDTVWDNCNNAYVVTQINYMYSAYPIGKIVLPNTIDTIWSGAFCEASDITTIDLGSGITYIDQEAFPPSLDTLIIRNTTPPSVYYTNATDNAFVGSNTGGINLATCKLFVPCGSKPAYNIAAQGWNLFPSANIIVSPSPVGYTFTASYLMPGFQYSTDFSYVVLSNTSTSSTVAITGMNSANSDWNGELYIPSTTTVGCPAGANYTITKVANSAFENNYPTITKVYIPNNIDTIGAQAFDYNHSLKYVQLGNSSGTCNLKCISSFAFSESALDSMKVYATTPPTCYSIGVWNYASYGNPNASVKVPCGTKAAYSAATGWNFFNNIKGMYDSDTTVLNRNVCYMESYYNNGFAIQNPTTGGVHYLNLTNSNGCDSVVKLNLNVYPQVPVTHFYDTICFGGTYNGNGFTNKTVAGDYSRTEHTQVGYCDSVVTLHLYVRPLSGSTINASICSGSNYTLNGFYIIGATASGMHTRTVTNSHGCDSIITLNLTVISGTNVDVYDTVCYGTTSYTENGFNITSPTTQVYSRTESGGGCPYTMYLHLNVLPQIATNHIYDTMCFGESYNDYDFIGQTVSDNYTRHVTTANGCDSVVTLHLHVRPPARLSITDSICAGQTYTQYGFNVSTPGQHIRHVTTANGCDSSITLNLTWLLLSSSLINDYVCYGEPYTANGFNITNPVSQSYMRTATSANGCDSNIFLQLTVLPPVSSSTINAAICYGTSYTQNGFNVSTAGQHTRVVQNADGCDSTIILNLTVYPQTQTNVINAAICYGQTYTQNGFSTATAGQHTRHVNNANGCDSVIILNLTVYPQIINTWIDASICYGQTYTDNGFNVSTAGQHTRVVQNANGCDSLIILNLSIYPQVQSSTINAAICYGQTYTQNGFNVSTAGQHTLVVQNANGCDSTIVLNLTVYPQVQTNTINASICYGQTYTLNGFNTGVAGQHIRTVQNANGCDSNIVLNLTVYPQAQSTINAAICYGQTYTQNGFNVSTAGTHTRIVQNANGCDSTITLNLTVYPQVQTNVINAAICYGQTYTLNGFNTGIGGQHTRTVQNANGCDSTIVLNLTVYPQVQTNVINAAICYGQTYTLNGFNTGVAGQHTRTVQNANGCDSTIVLNLTVYPQVQTNVINAAICYGQTYTLNGFNTGVAGQHTRTVQNANGCDSNIVLNLTVYPQVQTNTINAAICYGQTYTQNGFNVSTAGTHTRVVQNANGCDSTITLNLTVYPQVQPNVINASICFGSTYTLNGFNTGIGGQHTRTVQNANGCDSTIVLNLTVYPQVQPNVINASICFGSTYTLNGFNTGIGGQHTRTVQNANGCDSTIVLNLTVYPQVQTNVINAAICYGQTYTLNGFNTGVGGQHTRTVQNANGCDSTIILNLTVYPQVQTNTINAAVCYGQTYTLNGFNENATGQYTRTVQNANGCDSVIVLNLTVYPQAQSTINASICNGQTYTQNGFNVSTAGTYTRTVTNANGCDSTITLILAVLNGGDTTTINDFACYGTTYNGNGFSNLTSSGIYFRTETNSSGCEYVVKLVLTVYPQAASTINAAICNGETYTLNGFNVSTAGTYTRTVQNANGCDSVITLILAVLNGGDTTHVYDNVCEGMAYINNGFNIANPQAQTYYRTETNESGCEYVIALHLTISQAVAPTDLSVEIMSGSQVLITWNGTASLYEIWRNNTPFATQNGTSFVDNQVSAGQQYCYKVMAVEGDCQSDFTSEECVTINSLADVEGWNINVYPNPTTDRVTVEGEGLERIVVFDLTGKEVMSVNVTESKTPVNIGGLPLGAYTMRIIADNKIVSTKKIIKQ